MNKAISFACVLGLCGVGQLQAADLTMPAPALKAQPAAMALPGWAGPYLGVQAGYLSGRSETDFPGTGEFHFNDPKGFAGGVVGGYALQWGRVVAGLEADLSYIHAGQTTDIGLGPDPTVTQLQTKMDWNAHLRGRVGYGFDSVLIFAAGGLAVAGVQNKAIDNVVGVTATWNDTRVGWSIGGGADLRVARNVKLRLEYLYDNYGATTGGAQSVGTVNFAERDHKLDSHTLRTGINWHF